MFVTTKHYGKTATATIVRLPAQMDNGSGIMLILAGGAQGKI